MSVHFVQPYWVQCIASDFTYFSRSNGRISFNETVPDTITSWIASAYAVHPTTGLGVANPTPEVKF